MDVTEMPAECEHLAALIRFHETGGHEGEGSDYTLAQARRELHALTTAQSEAVELRKEVERKDAHIKQLVTVLHGVGGLLETNVRTKARDDHAEQKMIVLIRAALKETQHEG